MSELETKLRDRAGRSAAWALILGAFGLLFVGANLFVGTDLSSWVMAAALLIMAYVEAGQSQLMTALADIAKDLKQ